MPFNTSAFYPFHIVNPLNNASDQTNANQPDGMTSTNYSRDPVDYRTQSTEPLLDFVNRVEFNATGFQLKGYLNKDISSENINRFSFVFFLKTINKFKLYILVILFEFFYDKLDI